jgi:signal transduction histidine kinase
MLHVFGCITEQHDLRLVVLAGVLCLFACITAMSLLARARAAQDKTQVMWLAGAGVVAGCGIWGTHFVAMLAYRSGVAVAYDPTLTILSIVIAATLCSTGFAMAIGRPGPVLGGAVTGTAIGAMHYVGMAAVRIPAVAVWDWHYVVASVVIGISAMALGMGIVVRRSGWQAQAAGAVIFTLAICSMHFTGMSAVTYHLDPTVLVPDAVVEPTVLAIAVAAIAVLIVALGLVGSLVDSHLSKRAMGEAERLRAYIVELETTKGSLEQTTESLMHALDAAAAASQAKSAFLAAMSHELRTPLNAVIGFSDLLCMETFGSLGSARNKGYAKDIHSSGKHLLALINDILDIARIDAGEGKLYEELLALEELVTNSLRMVAHQAKMGEVRLSEEIDSDLPFVHADERRLKQVLINLLGNAVKFTNPGGEVHVRVLEKDGELIISVSDTGIGMAANDIPVALERFGQIDSTLARRYEGTGLGLPLAKQLAELHGGRLSIESCVGVGTIVTVALPGERIVRQYPTALPAA